MRKILLFLLVAIMPSLLPAQGPTKFEIKDGDFYVNGKATRILSGEMHYSRIPHQYWRHRLRMMKAMGLNTVATYVFWNWHEPAPGQWDFEGDKNLAEYIKTAGEEGMMVILRPGPYVCAEWEFGGYPWWLQNVEGMEIRRDNAAFLAHTKKYINRLYQEVGHLQCTKGGPIIMVQCENEFGSYVHQRQDIPLAEHRSYNAKIKQQLSDAGFNVPFFTSDGSWLFEGGSTPGALPTANGESNIKVLKDCVDQYHGGKGPYMVAEFYSGWLAHWAEPHPRLNAGALARQTELYMQNDVSINFYMVHGGTNFAFTAGANYDKRRDIQPDLTSYDYDAPISEAGWATPKYDSIRTVLSKYIKGKLPKVPAPNPIIEISEIKLSKVADVLTYAESAECVEADHPLTFEELGQGYGYVLYSRHFNQPITGTLMVPGLRDFAVVYVDGEKVGELNRNTQTYELEVNIPFNSTLQILVENMGRINYGSEIVHNKKGIIETVTIGDMPLTGGWKMSKLPMSEMPDLAKMNKRCAVANTPSAAKRWTGMPVMYEGTFTLKDTGDTFLNMNGWGKGIVFVNGHNLGRYWHVGPQQTLYIPGVWLNKGENKIVIFEQLNDEAKQTISAQKTPILDQME